MIRDFTDKDFINLRLKNKCDIDLLYKLYEYAKISVLEKDGEIILLGFEVERYDMFESGLIPMENIDKYCKEALIDCREFIRNLAKKKRVVTYSDDTEKLNKWHIKLGYKKVDIFKNKIVWEYKE